MRETLRRKEERTEKAKCESFYKISLYTDNRNLSMVALELLDTIGRWVYISSPFLSLSCSPSLFPFSSFTSPSLPLPFPLLSALRIALDGAKALAYLHSLTPPVVHGDVKSPNVLLACDDPNAKGKEMMKKKRTTEE